MQKSFLSKLFLVSFLLLVGFTVHAEQLTPPSATPSPVPTPPAAPVFTFTTNLYYGLRNNTDVIQLQQFLTSHGYYKGPVSGNFLSQTRAAVRAFQLANHITPAVGFLGPATRQLMQSMGETDTSPSSILPCFPCTPGATTGNLAITKLSQGGDGTFPFIISNTRIYIRNNGTIAKYDNNGETLHYNRGEISTGNGQGSISSSLEHGEYFITLPEPNDWEFGSISCDRDFYIVDHNAGTPIIKVVIDTGLTTNCTITDKKEPTLTITKRVNPSTTTSFTLYIESQDFQYPVNLSNNSSSTLSVHSGMYSIDEPSMDNNRNSYISSFSGDCDARGNITLNFGDNKSCTVTNTRVERADIKVIKKFEPASSAVSRGFFATLDGARTRISFDGDGGFVLFSADIGTHTIGEIYDNDDYVLPNNYTASYSGDCDSAGRITITENRGHKECTITNTMIEKGTLVLVKDTIPDSGTPFEFNFSGRGGLPISDTVPGMGSYYNGNVINGGKKTYSVDVGEQYAITENPVMGMQLVSTTCTIEGQPVGTTITNGIINIEVEVRKTTTCIFINVTDTTPTLTVRKIPSIDNIDTGYSIVIDGHTYLPGNSFTNTNASVVGPVPVSPGNHHVSVMVGPTTYPYMVIFGGDCNSSGNTYLYLAKTCTVEVRRDRTQNPASGITPPPGPSPSPSPTPGPSPSPSPSPSPTPGPSPSPSPSPSPTPPSDESGLLNELQRQLAAIAEAVSKLLYKK